MGDIDAGANGCGQRIQVETQTTSEGSRGGGFADVEEIAATVRNNYRYIDAQYLVVYQSLVKVVVV